MRKARATAHHKRLVEQRADGNCEYCRSPSRFSTQSFSVEHITPRDAGGPTTLENLAWSCQGCNNHKHTKTEAPDPLNGELVPLYHPRQQHWREHFAWSADFTLVVGLTPTGRATVQALHLNREGLTNLRWALYLLGKHPPRGETGSDE